ncbi:MAG: Spy/CpxP family protein refolding chaperone [Terriglobales bacterium]
MKSKYFKILAVTLALTVMAAIGVSQTVKRAHMRGDGMFAGDMFGGHMLGFYGRKLDLTDAQRAQVKDILTKEKPTIQPMILQMAQGHQQLQQLVMTGSFDEAKVRALAAQQTQTMTELTVQRARIASELYQVLTPDQKTKLSDMVTQHQQHLMNHLQGQGQPQTQNQ